MPPTGPASADAVNKLLIAGIVGSALAFIGSFLAWVSGEYEGQTETASGMDGDGMFTLITSLVAIGLFVFGLVRKNSKIAAISVLPTLITVVIGFLNVFDPERTARSSIESEAKDAGFSGAELDQAVDEAMGLYEFSPGMGLYVVVVGALVALVAGAMAGLKARSATQ
jgi:hypothetical protein